MDKSEFWNKLKKRLVEVSTAAADFTEEQALIGKLKFDILTLKRKIDHRQREIGLRICELAKEDPRPLAFNDGEIVRLLSEIDELEVQVVEKRDSITLVADQVRSKRQEQQKKAASKETDTTKPPPAKKTAAGRKKGTGAKRKTTTTRRRRSTTKPKSGGTRKYTSRKKTEKKS